MNGYNLYVIYSFKRIWQSSDSSLEFDVWWLDLFEQSSQDLCFARTWIWTCIAKRDVVIWCFEEYLDLSSKCYWRTLMGCFGLIQRASFFSDFKRRWNRLKNSLRESLLAWRGRESFLALRESLEENLYLPESFLF